MRLYGKVYNIIKKERIFSMIVNQKLCYFHMTNKNMRDFKAYLYQEPYVFVEVEEKRVKICQIMCYEVAHFIKILLPQRKKTHVFYDLDVIRKDIKALVNKKQYRMFLDLEFSLPTNIKKHTPEIVQYGLIVEDPDHQIIFQDFALVRPIKKSSLSQRTLKFLSLEYKDFKDASSYIAFYQLLQRWIRDYDIRIIAWGRNDILTLEQSFKINHLQPLDIRKRYLNLMQIMKNYYHYRQEMGLFHTYQELSSNIIESQAHNAFEDAFVAREIFHMFRNKINHPKKTIYHEKPI